MGKEVLVKVVVDASQVGRGFTKASQTAKKFEKDMSQVNRGVIAGSGAFSSFGRSVAFASTPFLGAAGLVAAVKSSVDAASDMNEQMSKTNVVFGKSAGQVKAWAKTTTTAFGISQREAVATASSFGALFRPLGLAGKQAAEQSEQLTQLGADLASFYNTDVQSALDAIRSGILGESEPLRQYGVVLSETRVQQEALRETGKKHVQALTAQEKALARIKIIFEDTKVAQGDYGKTAGGLANQTRTLTANLDDLKVNLGEKLVPALTDATTKVNDFMDAWGQSGTTANDVKFSLGVIGDALDGLRNNKTWGLGKLATPLWDALAVGPHNLMKAIRLNREFFRDKSPVRAGPHGDDVAIAAMKGTHGKALSADIAAGTLKAQNEAARKWRAAAGQRNAWFDAIIGRQLSRVSDAPINQQLGMLQKISVALSKRIAVTKDITRQLSLEDQLYAVGQQQKQVREQQQQEFFDRLQFNVDKTDLTKTVSDNLAALAVQQQAIEKAIGIQGHTLALDQALLGVQQALAGIHDQQAQAAQDAKAAAQEAAKAAQAETLAWATFAEERAAATPGLKDDLKTALATLAILKQQAGVGKRTASEAQAIWEQQQKVNQLLNKGKASTLFRGFNANKWIQQLGLNLNPAQVARLRAGVVQIGRGGTTPQRAQAFAAAGGMTVNIGHFHSAAPNPKQLQNDLIKHAKSQPHPRRGAR